MPRLAIVCLILALPVLPACQSGRFEPPPAGAVTPTVAGGAASGALDAKSAREAFTRRAGTLTATLEDASWLRFEGDPATVEARHRAYFDLGYTTFQVELRSKSFTQPTQETFFLEDDRGQRLAGRPVTFTGSTVPVDDAFFTSFALSFQHTLTRETRWLRLTRAADGSAVEWTFGPGPGR